MKTLTYVDALNFAIDQLDEAITASGSADWDEQAREVITKLTALRDQTAKRNSGDHKPTKTQVANEGLKATILSVLTADPATVSDIMTRSDELTALSNQKVSALVNALVRDGKVLKVMDGRKSTFCLA